MRIGNYEMSSCNECPAFSWKGENITKGDLGWYCIFGAFDNFYDIETPKEIPLNCPIKSSSLSDPKSPSYICPHCDNIFNLKEEPKSMDYMACPGCGYGINWIDDKWY